MSQIRRRDFLKGVGAAGALLLTRPRLALGAIGLNGAPVAGASRASKLLPGSGLFVAHTDLHNHSLISGDAAGKPTTAYAAMRSRGIDVACLTEHAISGQGHGEVTCPGHNQGGCDTVEGINETDWEYMSTLADEAYAANEFVSFRGFEWSTPTVGHVNVWFSEQYTDGLRQNAFITPTAIAEVDRVAPVPSEIVDQFSKAPELATMRFFYEWLASAPDRDIRSGGNDGIACFNHPNEFGTFENFAYESAAAKYVVSCEALNADRDFFWFGLDYDPPRPNPLNACLNAGWKVGFTGVSDEHSTEYGKPEMARGGLWLPALTREAVRAALESRRSFATWQQGLRLDAMANGAPMGADLVHTSGPISVLLDVDGGAAWPAQKRLIVEVIRPGANAPTLAKAVEVIVPGPDDPPIAFDVDVDLADGTWMFLRITDPDSAAHPLATGDYIAHGRAVAYTSPWFFSR
jgi:hypothetical protein